ncbi:MAG: 1-acyl-sn-glycerol-3-phosphate acyltransferase [Ilumatobacteraceae bacterium]
MPHKLETSTVTRRATTIPGLFAAAIGLTVFAPIWFPLTVVADVVRGRFRCPTTRLLAFGFCWAWLETAGVLVATAMWLTGQRNNRRAHYELQRWWSKNLLGALRQTCGITVDVAGMDAFDRGNALLFVRHASLADSLVSAFVATTLAGLQPRFVLKRELLLDPCLDVVGHRIPNYFLDRGAADSAPELASIAALVGDLGPRDIGIIFPEGTRANPAKRSSALDKIAGRDPARAIRLGGLRHLLPPRPGGAKAMVVGAPDADVVLAWHVGFEGLDTFAGILAALNRRMSPIRFSARRVAAADVPRDERFEAWLDEQWLQLDAEVAAALTERT